MAHLFCFLCIAHKKGLYAILLCNLSNKLFCRLSKKSLQGHLSCIQTCICSQELDTKTYLDLSLHNALFTFLRNLKFLICCLRLLQYWFNEDLYCMLDIKQGNFYQQFFILHAHPGNLYRKYANNFPKPLVST